MTIEIAHDGTSKWNFYRKQYKKSRWRKVGQRMLNAQQKYYQGYSGLIIVI